MVMIVGVAAIIKTATTNVIILIVIITIISGNGGIEFVARIRRGEIDARMHAYLFSAGTNNLATRPSPSLPPLAVNLEKTVTRI